MQNKQELAETPVVIELTGYNDQYDDKQHAQECHSGGRPDSSGKCYRGYSE